MECMVVDHRRPCQRGNSAHRWHHRHHHRRLRPPQHLKMLRWHRTMVVRLSMQRCTQENAAPGQFVKIFVMTRRKVNPIKIINSKKIWMVLVVNRSIVPKILWKEISSSSLSSEQNKNIFLQIINWKMTLKFELQGIYIPISGHFEKNNWKYFRQCKNHYMAKMGIFLVTFAFRFLHICWLFGMTELCILSCCIVQGMWFFFSMLAHSLELQQTNDISSTSYIRSSRVAVETTTIKTENHLNCMKCYMQMYRCF